MKENTLTPVPPPAGPHVVLGMLGGVGSGKSHVARRAAALGGGRIVDADTLAKEALAAAAADGRLAAALGEGFVQDGRADVRAIGARAFEDAAFLARLEALVHPPVQAAIQAAVEAFRATATEQLLVLDVPLLIEVGLDRRCDALWYVETPDALRAERGAARDLTLAEIHRREAHQTPLVRKRARADRVIDNSVDAEALDTQVRTGLEALGLDLRTPNHPIQAEGSRTRGPSA